VDIKPVPAFIVSNEADLLRVNPSVLVM
jgi:hypothetical protein